MPSSCQVGQRSWSIRRGARSPGSCSHRLKAAGHQVEALRLNRQYIAMDAAEALDRFMVDGYPDERLFAETITSVINAAQQGGQRVRAFG